MRIRTTRERVRQVADRWHQQYPKDQSDVIGIKSTDEIWHRLRALDVETATKADVDRIIGVAGWADVTCDTCKAVVDVVVEMGEPSDYESRTADCCPACLRAALAMLDEEAH